MVHKRAVVVLFRGSGTCWDKFELQNRPPQKRCVCYRLRLWVVDGFHVGSSHFGARSHRGTSFLEALAGRKHTSHGDDMSSVPRVALRTRLESSSEISSRPQGQGV